MPDYLKPAWIIGGVLALSALSGCANDTEFTSGPRTTADEPGADAVGEPGGPGHDVPVGPDDGETVNPGTGEVTEPTPAARTVAVEGAFPAARLVDQQVVFQPEYRRAKGALTLTEDPPVETTVRQAERPYVSETHRQGHDGAMAGPETFAVSEAGILDLLVVVDDSTSMEEEQANLSSKLEPLISSLSNVDWRIGVITTSSPCLRQNRLIKKGDADAAAAFATAATPGLDPVVVEYGFPMAIRALRGECGGVVSPWLRAGSAVGVLILSDEDNCGSNSGEGCPTMEGKTSQEMVNFLNSIRPAGQARVYGLIEGANECGSRAYTGTKYLQAVQATGGTWGSICDRDYTATLQKISDNVRRIVRGEFTLSQVPDGKSIEITVDGRPVTTGYTLAGRVLTVSALGPDDLRLSVSYSYGAVERRQRFALKERPDTDSLTVKVNGAPDSADNWSYVEADQEVAFTAPPVDSAEIVFSYRKRGGPPAKVPVTGIDIAGAPLAVTVDGADVPWTFDPAAKTLAFGTAPADGALIKVVHKTRAGRHTRYPAAVADTLDVEAVSAVDAAGSPVPVRLDGRDLVFGADDVTEGRQVTVTYDLGYLADSLQYDLGVEPVPGSAKVRASASAQACAKGTKVEGSVVRFACDPGDVGEVTILWQVVAERFETFTLDGEIPAGAVWTVTVDGRPVTDFVREGATVRVPSALLTPVSTVRLKAEFAAAD